MSTDVGPQAPFRPGQQAEPIVLPSASADTPPFMPPQAQPPAAEVVKLPVTAMWVNAALSLLIVAGVGLIAFGVLIFQTVRAVRWANNYRRPIGRYIAPIISVVAVYTVAILTFLVIGLTVGSHPYGAPATSQQAAQPKASAPKPAANQPTKPRDVFAQRLAATGDLAIVKDQHADPTKLAQAIEHARLFAFGTHNVALLASLYQSADTPGYQADLKFLQQPNATTVSPTTTVAGTAGDGGYATSVSNYSYHLNADGSQLANVNLVHVYQFDPKLGRWVITQTDLHQ